MKKEEILNIIKDMTIEEKVAQLTQLNPSYFDNEEVVLTGPYREWNFPKELLNNIGSVIACVEPEKYIKLQKEYLENNRHKIPLLFMSDVIHGLKTIFPIPLALACSFNEKLCEDVARISAKESAAIGIHITFSPMCDLVRDARWGRVMESFGESPYLNAVMTKAMVKGYQNGDLNKEDSVVSCIKHFAAYGAAEGGREYNTVDMSKGVLRDFYLEGYKAGIDENARMVMTSFNTVERIPSSANKFLLEDILRKEWRFTGAVISDFNSIDEVINHSVAEDAIEAGKKCLEIGLDIEMMSGIYINSIPKLIKEGKFDENILDKSVERVLNLKNELGLFENPYKSIKKDLSSVWLTKENREIAKNAARESIVLLKNDNNILPLNTNKKTVGIVGPFATSKEVLGGWRALGDEKDTISLYEGISNILGKENIVTYMDEEVFGMLQGFIDIPDKIEECISKLEGIDIVIVAIGESQEDTGEGASKTNIRVSQNQEKLIKELKKQGKKVITVLYSGRPMEILPIIDYSDAFIQGWFLGTESGNALAEVIFGKYNPSGRLAMCIPRNVGQIPVYHNCYNTGRPYLNNPYDRYSSRYIDCLNTPLLPFGYGLNYSNFEYSNLVLEQVNHNDIKIKAKITIKNNSNVFGKETVQLYIQDIYAKVVRPLKELKDFKQVEFEPFEEKIIQFDITEKMLKFYDNDDNFIMEEGDFVIFIGKNSEENLYKKIYIK